VVGAHALKTLIILCVLVVGYRVLGKRSMAQLNVYDLAMLIALSNAVQNAMTGGLGSLWVGLATSSTIVIAAWALTRIVLRSNRLESAVVGSPAILVNHGQVIRRQLRHERVTEEELNAACRARGIENVDDVELAILEVDGTITVIGKRPPRAR
jgi:uncharacterized membrane protein YcaP (DUF421 family)